MAEETKSRSGALGNAMGVIKANRLYIKVLFLYLAVSLIMFWPVTISIFTNVINGHGDVYQTLFNLWWFPYALLVLHQTPYFTALLHFPIGANLVTQTLTPLAGILVSPIYSLSPAFSYNLLYFGAFALSGLFMFMLADYILNNKYAALLAGLVFAFSPFHIAQSMGHLDWTIIEFMPLFILFYMKTLRERKLSYAAIAAVSFLLLTFMGDIEQGIMMFFFGIILTVLMLAMERKDLLKVQTFTSIGVFAVITLVLCAPFILLMLPYLNSNAFGIAQQNSAVASNMEWSDNLASFFLPSWYNGIFQGVANSYLNIYELTYQGLQYTINIGERVSYLGYTVLALALFGIWADYKHNKLKHSMLWIIIFVIFAWLALGPYLQIGSTVTGIPGLYLLYRDIPLLNIIREPGRFDSIATIALAILAAMGFAQLAKGKHHKDSLKYLAIVSILVLIEYNGMPFFGSYASSFTTSAVIPQGYSQIGSFPGNFSTLTLPALPNDSATPSTYIGLQSYYVTATHKPAIGGYTSRTNDSQNLAAEDIPLVTSASYLEYGVGFVYPSPINENYTNVTLLWLGTYNTAFVTVARQAYNLSSQELLYSYLTDVFGSSVYQDNTTFIFSTQQAISARAGKSLVSYTVGNWTPGYSLCNPYQQCNATLGSMWWGDNPRGIIIYSPTEQNIVMSFNAITPVNGTPLAIYLNSAQTPYTTLTLSEAPTVYDVNMTIPSGFSEVGFVSSVNAADYPAPYLLYGMENITFTPG